MSGPTCSGVQDRLPEFARNALDPASTVEIRAHVAACADCRAELELVRALGEPVAVPAGLEDRVVQAIRARPSWRGPAVRHYAVAASFVLALVTASVIWRGGERGQGQAAPADPASVVTLEWPDTRNPLLPETTGLQALSEEELVKLLQELES